LILQAESIEVCACAKDLRQVVGTREVALSEVVVDHGKCGTSLARSMSLAKTHEDLSQIIHLSLQDLNSLFQRRCSPKIALRIVNAIVAAFLFA